MLILCVLLLCCVPAGAALTVFDIRVYDDRLGGAGRRGTHSQGICEGIESVAGVRDAAQTGPGNTSNAENVTRMGCFVGWMCVSLATFFMSSTLVEP